MTEYTYIYIYISRKDLSTLFCKFVNIGYLKGKVKWSRYRPGVAQRVGRGIALLFHDRGTRREWVVSSTPRPHFTPGKDPVPILQESGWAKGPVWTGGKSRPHRDSIPDRPAAIYTSDNIQIRDKMSRGLGNDKPTINHLTMARPAVRRVRM